LSELNRTEGGREGEEVGCMGKVSKGFWMGRKRRIALERKDRGRSMG